MKNDAFTLIEAVLTTVVIAIVSSLVVTGYLKEWKQQVVIQGAQQISSGISEVRNSVRKRNSCQSVTFGSTSYTVTQYTTSDCSGAAQPNPVTYTLPQGTSLTIAGGVNIVNFVTPYGTNGSGQPIDLNIKYADDSSLQRNLRVTAVLGKVVIQ